MNIKVITIDFWNTIFDSSNGNERNIHRIKEMKNEISRMGLNISEEKYQNVLEQSWEYFNNIWRNQQRTPSAEESRNFFWEKLNLPDNNGEADKILKIFAESVLYYPPKLIVGAKEALEELSHNYKLALVSDTGFSPGKILRRLMYENDILHYFSAFSFSDETEVAKPHSTAFLTILDQFNVKPSEALHVGDIEDTDIKGAKSLGMYAVRFNGDPTALLNLNKSKESIADFMSDNWKDIVLFIKSLN